MSTFRDIIIESFYFSNSNTKQADVMSYGLLLSYCKRNGKHRMDVIASLASNRNYRYNTPSSFYELVLYIEIHITIVNTKLKIYS